MTQNNRFKLASLTAMALFLLFPTVGAAGAEDQSMKVSKTGTVTLITAHSIGDSTLEAGVYTVQHRVRDSGDHYVYFTPRDKSGQQVAEPVQCQLEFGGKKIPQTRTENESPCTSTVSTEQFLAARVSLRHGETTL